MLRNHLKILLENFRNLINNLSKQYVKSRKQITNSALFGPGSVNKFV